MRFEEVFCNTFKAIRKTISPDVRKSVDFSIPSMPMVAACRADDFDFFAPFIAAGDLTVKQMQHACKRYYLGKTRSGRAREPLIASWHVTHCLFGLHLFAESCFCHTDITDNTDFLLHSYQAQPVLTPLSVRSVKSVCHKKTVCVVESERSAVILSELFPEYVWMAYATTAHLRPELFAPLLGHKVVLFPRTDPTLSNFLFFKDLAAIVRQEYEIDISVDDTLEKRATPEQKERCIDMVDFIFSHG